MDRDLRLNNNNNRCLLVHRSCILICFLCRSMDGWGGESQDVHPNSTRENVKTCFKGCGMQSPLGPKVYPKCLAESARRHFHFRKAESALRHSFSYGTISLTFSFSLEKSARDSQGRIITSTLGSHGRSSEWTSSSHGHERTWWGRAELFSHL